MDLRKSQKSYLLDFSSRTFLDSWARSSDQNMRRCCFGLLIFGNFHCILFRFPWKLSFLLIFEILGFFDCSISHIRWRQEGVYYFWYVICYLGPFYWEGDVFWDFRHFWEEKWLKAYVLFFHALLSVWLFDASGGAECSKLCNLDVHKDSDYLWD